MTKEEKIAELKQEAHARVRARVEHLNADERARYRAQLGADDRRTFDIIMRGRPASAEAVSPERARMRLEMDRRMGLLTPTASVVRTSIQLSASVLGSPSASAGGSGALQRRPPGPERHTPQRQPPAKSAEQLEMDRRMGLQSGDYRIHRTATSLTFSLASD